MTIKPEAGKRYVMRNGCTTGVISLANTHAYDNYNTWLLSGKHNTFPMYDLVSVAVDDADPASVWITSWAPTEEELHDAAMAKGELYVSNSDTVNQPMHYRAHPYGIECIQITEHMGFNLGNAVKYIWRCDLKADDIEDLRKAAWYIQREIDKRLAACAGELV